MNNKMKVLAKKLCSLKFFPFHVYDVYVLCMYECLYICLSVCLREHMYVCEGAHVHVWVFKAWS